MCSAQEQTLFQVKDSHESAMHVSEDTVSRRLGATNKTCLYFIIATLATLLVFALATIMVLVIQRTAADPATEGITEPIRKGNTSEDFLRILQNVPTKGAAAYMRVSSPVNGSKLSLVGKGVCEDIQCKSEELVIRQQGLYLIYCHLNFHFANCSNSPTDLKIEFLVNGKVNRQTLSTLCASDTCQEKTFKTLFQLHLTYLNVEDRISVTLNHPKFLNEISLPNDNVLGVLRYSDEM
ncbi:tumor necrosis factor ligand superfamily member 8 [Anser cygnoides]|uniref:TNF superfamily member 8 n=2 Tax=Anser TaxID=8842 RepID=A0A8B9D3S4_9AVES|nr:tumor necrosis factor ligand superfamily member 8 [Anser cygnoides]XP_035420482.1 tumor necrosis factor ligand superfamily member 8 [Cygnus atratus]XP_040387716.1 tumor necrosis factor ligand superfamily member 8 [Cygnus olor]XP_040387717.1 tumor necrosis factor ligand superfamily member 8 [Cygnus olor]XP_040387718.1 tumor necrosis factor ligand superfamily member 8 [Cygnus olor]